MFEVPKNHQLINCHFFYRNKKQNRNKDVLMIISKDKTGKKYVTEIEDPDFEYYVTKPEYYDGKIRNFVPESHTKKCICKYSNLYKSMSTAVKDKEILNIYKKGVQENSKEILRELHLDYRFHSSDINITDFYIKKFLEQNPFEDNSYGLTYGSADIEVDSSEIVGFANPEEALCPVNIISLYLKQNNTCYIFALEYDTDTYKDYMNNKEEIKNSYERIKEKYDKFSKDIKFVLKTFENEIDLIYSFFHTINTIKPDYLFFWNAAFDIMTLYQRIKNLGYSPEDIMCPEEFNNKRVFIKLDTKNQDPAEKNDTFDIVSYTNYVDLMSLYANITKPFGKKESYSLDYIGELETGLNKEEVSTNIKTLHYDNYKNFFEYNIQDSLLLAFIEKNTNNIELLHTVALLTRTRPNKALKKTICLRNFADKFYKEKGMIISNNHSSLLPQLTEKIKGAFVADPNLIEEKGFINGKPTNRIFDFVVDFDLSALYPSIIRAFNISPDTKYGKIIYHELVYEKDGVPFPNGVIVDKSPTFMNHLMTRDSINFCHEYYNLPDIEEMYYIIKENCMA